MQRDVTPCVSGLQQQVRELEQQRELLAQRLAWALLRLRECSERALRAMGELEDELGALA